MNGVTLRRLHYFIAVAEEMHFGRAADRLGIAQPPLSQQIQRLEAAVGCPLLRRRPRVELTAVGRTLLGVARGTLDQLDTGIEKVRREARGEIGLLRVGAGVSFMLTHLPDIVRAYRERSPDVDLRLMELSTAAQVEALRRGVIDLGFLRQPKAPDDFAIEILMREPLVAVLPSAHPLSSRPRVALSALADEPFVHFPRNVAPDLYDHVLKLCQDAGFRPQIVQQATEWLTIVALVGTGVGVSLVPTSIRDLQWGAATYRPLSQTGVETSVAVCRRRGELLPAAKQFIEVARHITGQRLS